jgi:hypothetical protein
MLTQRDIDSVRIEWGVSGYSAQAAMESKRPIETMTALLASESACKAMFGRTDLCQAAVNIKLADSVMELRNRAKLLVAHLRKELRRTPGYYAPSYWIEMSRDGKLSVR